MELNRIVLGDALERLKELPDECIQMCVTSPPYYKLRDYGVDGQYGQEQTPEMYIRRLVTLFNEVKRVLKPSGTLWLNLGDSYWRSCRANKRKGYMRGRKAPTGFGKPIACMDTVSKGIHSDLKNKDLIGLPWTVAFELRKAGWYLRQDIIWFKPNAMPESTTDRCSKCHEYIFLLSKSTKYYFNYKAIQESAAYDGRKVLINKGSPKYGKASQGSLSRSHNRWQRDDMGNFVRNKRSVWVINLKPFMGGHYASFPETIPAICIKASSKEGDIVLDPFMGAGTTAVAAKTLYRSYYGIEINPEYINIAVRRLHDIFGLFYPGNG
ncbi:MAG: site-specific DNA-methyltransferase [Sphingobacterium sp.]|jgi:DNA modification methylase|nr:site-specific DNA-methyltransferase [Sphingobacterium sp.]